MVERTRHHERIAQTQPPGLRVQLPGILEQPVELFIPRGVEPHHLVIHAHGAPWLAEVAAARTNAPVALVAIQLGAGSGVYARAFAGPGTFARLVEAAAAAAGTTGFRTITLSAFSAGYGAVRSILRDSAAAPRIDAVLLLDGLHAGYRPAGRPLAGGGAIVAEDLEPFLDRARAAVEGNGALLITHSEIFPGTFASTTETTDWLLARLHLTRTPVLAWGPVGMQQLSVAESGDLTVLGFAGNTAPDHVDHLHALPFFLDLLMRRLPP